MLTKTLNCDFRDHGLLQVIVNLITHLTVPHLSDIHKLPVLVQHAPGLLSIIAQPDMSLQQGVQQLPKPLHGLNRHTHTNIILSVQEVLLVVFDIVVDCPTCKASSSHLNN